MAVPKRRKSKSRIGARHGAHAQRLKVPAVKACPQCGALHQPHRICPACGYYRGRQVVTVEAK